MSKRRSTIRAPRPQVRATPGMAAAATSLRRALGTLGRVGAVAAPSALLAGACIYVSLVLSASLTEHSQATAGDATSTAAAASAFVNTAARTVAALAVVIGSSASTAALSGLLLAGARWRDPAQRRRDADSVSLALLGRIATAGGLIAAAGLICQMLLVLTSTDWGPS